jgi:hypothetical protein
VAFQVAQTALDIGDLGRELINRALLGGLRALEGPVVTVNPVGPTDDRGQSAVDTQDDWGTHINPIFEGFHSAHELGAQIRKIQRERFDCAIQTGV